MSSSGFSLTDCTRCGLCEGRTNIVNGVGPRRSKAVFIGEAPGRDEDRAGRPFVGMAGRLLDGALEEAGSGRREVFVTNMVRCRPPGNRRPKEGEVTACATNLEAELKGMSPEVLCLMGRTVVESMSSETGKMADMVGRLTEARIGGRTFRAVVAYHPAACLYRRKNLDSFKSAVRKSLEEAGVV